MVTEISGAVQNRPIGIAGEDGLNNPDRSAGVVDIVSPFTRLSTRVNHLVGLLGGTSASFDNDSYSLEHGTASFGIKKTVAMIEDASYTYTWEQSVRIEFGFDGKPVSHSERVLHGRTRYEGPVVGGEITDKTIVMRDMERIMGELERRSGIDDHQKNLRTTSISNHGTVRREKPQRIHGVRPPESEEAA